jgi:hypothetical protein
VRAAAAGEQDAVFAEDFNCVSPRVYERLTDDEDDFWEAWETYSDAHAMTDEAGSEGMGESFNFDDAQQMRRRLPRLAELCLSPALG